MGASFLEFIQYQTVPQAGTWISKNYN